MNIFSTSNYYFFADSKPTGNFGNLCNYNEGSLESNYQDSFYRGLKVFYQDNLIIVGDPDQCKRDYDLIYKGYLHNNPNLCIKLKEVLSNNACVIQLIGEINDLKKFICAFFLFDMIDMTTFIINDNNKIDSIIDNNETGCIVISLIDLHSNSGYLNRELNNHVIILTKSKIISEHNSLELSFDNAKLNPFTYE